MNSQTGLSSILEKSIYKTQKRHKYSFGKSQRFPDMKSIYAIDFYNKPIPRDTRTCSFGYGNKYFFDSISNNPSSIAYNLPEQKGQGVTFGASREKVIAGDYLIQTARNITPNLYKYTPNQNSLSKFRSGPKCSMAKKNSTDSFLKIDVNPQPSKYDTNLEKNGRVTLSNFKSTKRAAFTKSQRFIDSLQKSLVGPGQYVVNDTFDSKNITPRRNVFSLAAKKNFADDAIKKSVTPGPIYYVA